MADINDPAVGGTPPPPAAPGSAVYPGSGMRVGKTRNPWGVWLLSLVTLGIYAFYWYYTVNREIRDYDSQIEVEPVISLIALFFFITTIVSFVRTGGRIAQAQRRAGASFACSGLAGILLQLLSFGVVYYQSQLNKVWDMHGNPEPGTRIAA